MRGKTEKLDKIIRSVLLKKGITKNIQLNKIRVVLAKIFSREELDHIRLGHLKNKKLYMYVDSASLLYEIRCFKKAGIIEKINDELGIKVTDISLNLENK
ncbi:MAG: DciA family protein [Planctomycetota bacterium]|jgi:hypothetical protein